MKILNKLAFSFFAIFATLAPAYAVDPYDNWPNPPGGYGVLYPLYYSADKFTDKNGDTLISNLDFTQYGNVFRYVYYGQKPYLLNFLIPMTKNKIRNPFTGQYQEDSGFGDARFSFGYWVINNRANNFYFGPGMDIDMPTGKYDQNNMASVGSNVWRFRPTLVLAKFTPPVDFEVTLRYAMETENKDIKEKSGDMFLMENYLGMFLNQKVMVGGHFNYFVGKDDKNNGVRTVDSAEKVMQVGGSIQWMATPKFNAYFQYLNDVSTENTVKGRLFLTRLVWKL